MRMSWVDTLLNVIIGKRERQPKLLEEQAIRCDRILNYWLDIELFDLPKCPFYDDTKMLSIEADHFITRIESELTKKIYNNPEYISDDSRLNIMFQCHRAGYILSDKSYSNPISSSLDNDYSSNPNLDIPRTFLVSHSFIPKWDKDTNTLLWSLSTDKQDIIVNLATIRMIYRKCPPLSAQNCRFSQWIQLMVEEIETLFNTRFSEGDATLHFTTQELQERIVILNRDLTKLFWPEPKNIAYMKKYCGSLETMLAHHDDSNNYEKDKPVVLKNGSITFRWRFCFYPKGNELQQLGPFYVEDLEHCIQNIEQFGVEGLSYPLHQYLLGNTNPKEIPNAAGNGEIFHKLTKGFHLGRWPENPKYSLSLLQKVAVDVALDHTKNPIVAVNGPPGTGKTTLLKDIIATRFVERTRRLIELIDSGTFSHSTTDKKWQSKTEMTDSWFTSAEARQILMSNSIIVASSNNKAVENISKELPAKSSIDSRYLNSMTHFRNVVPDSDWGMFCAVLGNSTNRRNFKAQLSKLQNHLKYLNDTFGLNQLVSHLKKSESLEDKLKLVENITIKWKSDRQILDLINDLNQCSNREKYRNFYDPFIKALMSINNEQLEISDFIEHWKQNTDDEWAEIVDSLDAVKKQWYAKKLYMSHKKNKLDSAKLEFNKCLNEIKGMTDWGFDLTEQLLTAEQYAINQDEDIDIVEKRLQLKSPFASEKSNDFRSRMFCAALALNEALVEFYATDFEGLWDDLYNLLEGKLISNEDVPYHEQLWALLFLICPIISTSLSSIENQFKQMQMKQGFGVAMIDEAGQAVNYHVVGLLQRCKQAIFVGDPIQLEPVVTIPSTIDFNIAQEYLNLSNEYNKKQWGDEYIVSSSSAQSIADLAGSYYSTIGERRVGIPLLVHRRCLDPMFSIANKIAYKDKMVLATYAGSMQDKKIIPSGWVNVEEKIIKGHGYANQTEAEIALELVEYLVNQHNDMVKGGIFIITPFTKMKETLQKEWRKKAKDTGNEQWMKLAFGEGKDNQNIDAFAYENIGTVHTFQGKEASIVILCLAASHIRNKMGGVKWVNSKPNLLNVAATRSKHHLFIIGNMNDWASGNLSSEFQCDNMMLYQDIEHLRKTPAVPYSDSSKYLNEHKSTPKTKFEFGG